MITPLGHRVFVKILPRHGRMETKLNLVLYDKRRHFEGVRAGEIFAVGDSVWEVKVGDVVWFEGARGESFGQNSNGETDNGVEYRRLNVRELLCVEERVAVAEAVPA
jgi:co-chaperonin GroES (HSP10)